MVAPLIIAALFLLGGIGLHAAGINPIPFPPTHVPFDPTEPQPETTLKNWKDWLPMLAIGGIAIYFLFIRKRR